MRELAYITLAFLRTCRDLLRSHLQEFFSRYHLAIIKKISLSDLKKNKFPI